MIHPETQRVVNYPDTPGKQVALQFYRWQSLDKTQEVLVAPEVVQLATLIDASFRESLREFAENLTEKIKETIPWRGIHGHDTRGEVDLSACPACNYVETDSEGHGEGCWIARIEAVCAQASESLNPKTTV